MMLYEIKPRCILLLVSYTYHVVTLWNGGDFWHSVINSYEAMELMKYANLVEHIVAGYNSTMSC